MEENIFSHGKVKKTVRFRKKGRNVLFWGVIAKLVKASLIQAFLPLPWCLSLKLVILHHYNLMRESDLRQNITHVYAFTI